MKDLEFDLKFICFFVLVIIGREVEKKVVLLVFFSGEDYDIIGIYVRKCFYVFFFGDVSIGKLEIIRYVV